jgi:hypothetical protein
VRALTSEETGFMTTDIQWLARESSVRLKRGEAKESCNAALSATTTAIRVPLGGNKF